MAAINPNLGSLTDDVLYHLGLSQAKDDFPALFGDVRFVCTGGTASRMEILAGQLYDVLKEQIPDIAPPKNWSSTERYVLYKVGPVLCVNHGIGIASLSVMLNELIKLLYYSKSLQHGITLLRCGTSGGIGEPAGTLVIADHALNAGLKATYNHYVLGELRSWPTNLNAAVVNELAQLAKEMGLTYAIGATVATEDFYQAQGRTNGAFCDYKDVDRVNFLKRAQAAGAKNFEMEATCVAAMCEQAGIRAGIICVTLVDRLITDQVDVSLETLADWETRPGKLALEYIRRSLMKKN